VLEQHVNFWDRDNDGQIYPLDTFRGFRDLGCVYLVAFRAFRTDGFPCRYNLLWSIFGMFIIHINFSFPTWPSWAPDPYFRIHIKNIHHTKVRSFFLVNDVSMSHWII
jgi:peroxygenase